MYKETRETVLTIFLTALIVGGGMYWFYNRNAEKSVTEVTEEETVSEERESAENEVSLPGLGEEEKTAVSEDASTELETAKAFEPQTFTNKGSHYPYSVDFPKNWYSKHYTWDGQDLAAFDTRPLPETSGQDTTGKIAIFVTTYQGAEELMASDEQWLTNVTKKTHMYAEAWPMTIMRGEMGGPALTLRPGATNVKMGAYINKDGQVYAFAGVGLTPDEEKIFEQMVASFRFEE